MLPNNNDNPQEQPENENNNNNNQNNNDENNNNFIPILNYDTSNPSTYINISRDFYHQKKI